LKVKLTIHPDRIDVTELRAQHGIDWKTVLDKLKAEHIPGFYQNGQRMGVNIVNGRFHAYIYRTPKTPSEVEIIKIFRAYGVVAQTQLS
jgi:hypothetical protein